MFLTLTFNFTVKCNSLRSPPSPAFGGLSRRERRKGTYARGLISRLEETKPRLEPKGEHEVRPYQKLRLVDIELVF